MARCQACKGSGDRYERLRWYDYENAQVVLDARRHDCPKCGGSGIENCCEGDREQPAYPRQVTLRLPELDRLIEEKEKLIK